MSYSKNIWQQLKGISKGEFIRALEKDEWKLDTGFDKYSTYRKGSDRRIYIHYHKSKDTFRNPKLLKMLLNATGWDEDDLRRLGLIK